MEGRDLIKSKHFLEYLAEKCMEWIEFLRYSLKGKREWTSNLTESYHIYERHSQKAYIKEFLAARAKILELNRYKMEITELPGGTPYTVGEVILRRKKKEISRATLCIKESDSNDNKLIYWNFKN